MFEAQLPKNSVRFFALGFVSFRVEYGELIHETESEVTVPKKTTKSKYDFKVTVVSYEMY